jgi:thiosulfate/3-mercaptopyruvate sulfurtransferase
VNRNALVSTTWLADHLADPALRVFDTTLHLEPTPGGMKARSGRAGYDEGHIPGAGFLDIVSDLSDPTSELAFTRPQPEQLGRVLARSGVGSEHRVVLYSAGDVMWATRAWWLLRWVGVARVSVLDGGFARWQAEGHPVSTAAPDYPPSRFEARPVERLWATQREVLEATEGGGACLINALPRPLHRGAASLGYRRSGHIKGSDNLPYPDLLEPGDGTFRSAAELREHFEATGALRRQRVICYCGGGIAATQNAFALTLLGHEGAAVYDGGLDEWSRDLALPMASEESG